MNQHRVATIEDVARIAGVSIATVSRAIHYPEKVADVTRRRVLDAIAQTGYTANAMAQSLRKRRANMILILAPDVGDPNFSNILVGLETEALKRGYGVLIGNTRNDPARETDYLGFVNSNKADGLILLTGHLPFGLHGPAERKALPPMVAVNEPVNAASVPFVGVDNFEGARMATDYLASQGHRRIAFIGRSSLRWVHQVQEDGYRAGLAGAGLRIDDRLIMDGNGSTESGRSAVEQMFVRDHLPTAFLCINDATALGVLTALSARGYNVPEDFSVMGFDDISFASFVTPALTTIRQPRLKIGEAAMDLMLELLEGRNPTKNEIKMKAELVVRDSVRPPKSVV